MKTNPIYKAFVHICLSGAAVTSTAFAATYTWDPGNTANGATINPGNGTWNTTAGNIVWNNAGTNVVWAQTNATTALHQAVFGGSDGTFAVSVGTNIAAQKMLFSNSGYTLSAASAQTITITQGGGSGTQPGLAVASGKSVTIGSNVTVSGSSTFYLGGDNGNPGGTLNIEGGTVRAALTTSSVVIDGLGTVVNVKTGGTLTQGTTGATNAAISVGQLLSSNASLNVQGGTVSVATQSGALNVGNQGQGTVTLTNGNITITGTGGVALGGGTVNVSNNVFQLDGGTLETPVVKKGAGTGSTATFNFNGGTLKANASTTTFMEGLTTANVKSGGAKIDTQNFNITVAQSLVADSSSGGLTKEGAGTLSLSGVSTYIGDTLINNGTLALTSTGELKFSIGANGVNNKITGTGTVTLDGLFTFDLTSASTTLNDSWNIVNVATLTESFDTNFAINGFTPDGGGILWNGSANGADYQFSEMTGVLTVIPEPSTALLGALGMLAMLRRRR